MAPPKKTTKTQEDARASNNCLMTDFFKRACPGRTKKRATLASDELDTCCASPPSSQSKITKKPKKDNAALEDTTAKPLGVVNDKVNIENAV